MIERRLVPLVAAAMLLCALSSAQAALVYDIRFDDSDTSGGYVSVPGQTVTLDLFARVTGIDNSMAAVEGFQEGYGSIMATLTGDISGSISSTLAAPFQASGSQGGHANNLDGDSVLDIGSNQTVQNSDFIFARATQIQSTGGTPTLAGDGMEFKLATITFTLGTGDQPFTYGSTLHIGFALPNFTSLTSVTALWMEDGVYQVSSMGSTAVPTVGAGITLTAIPEPSSALLLGVGVLVAGAVRRRRTGQSI